MQTDVREHGPHLTPEELRAFRMRQLSPQRLLALDEHLDHCTLCSAAIAPGDLVAGRGASDHLTFDTLVSYLDRKLPALERESADRHLTVCPACRADLDDLRAIDGPASPERRGSIAWRWALASGALGVALAAVPLAILLNQSRHEAAQAQHRLSELREAAEQREREARRQPPLPRGPNMEESKTASSTPHPLPAPTAPRQAASKQSPKRKAPVRKPQSLRLTDGGAPIELGPTGSPVRLEPLPPAVREALRRGAVEVPAFLASLQVAAEPVRGSKQTRTVEHLYPVGTGVLSTQPVLRWKEIPAVEGYEVTVLDVKTGATQSSGPLQASEWQVTPPLERGKTYAWQVKVRGGEGGADSPLNTSRLRVLDEEAARKLEAEAKAYAGSPLTLGVLYAKAGLAEEAERELGKLVEQNPSAALPRMLLASLRALRARR